MQRAFRLDVQATPPVTAERMSPGVRPAPSCSATAVRLRKACQVCAGAPATAEPLAGSNNQDTSALASWGVQMVCDGAKVAGPPWKIRLPAHGSIPAREAPIAPWSGRLLRAWLDTRSALQITGHALFPAARSGRPWGKVAQYTAAKAVLAAAGVPDTEGGSFKLRHAFALRQLRRGTSADQVTQWTGLADAAALARYRRVLLAPSTEVV